MIKKKKVLVVCMFLMQTGFSQDYSWWNEQHQWDGVTHWTQYLKLTSKYMGPNALPVPALSNGTIDSTIRVVMGADVHYGKGDQTTNAITTVMVPFGNKAALRIEAIPFEFFQTDTITRDLRKARDRDGRGYSLGDIYVGAQFQVVKDHPKWPDMLLSFHIKTATGDNLSSARHTDAPAYYFDLSLGKNLNTRNKIGIIRPYFLGGFYAYQTYRTDYYQNDCFLFGAGLSWRKQHWLLSSEVGGYLGYFKDGDQPVVARLRMERKRIDKVNLFLQFQQGLHDYGFTSLRFGAVLPIAHWTKMQKQKRKS